MKILIVEDEEAIRENVAAWLTFEGYDVTTARNGREGVEKALQVLPDLMLCDITMPELDGYGVLLDLQANPRTSAIPFIFLTARADKSFVRHGMEMGADDYITKPFTREELLAAIAARINRRDAFVGEVRQEVDELKTKIIRLVSHELRTPLASLVFVQHLIERQLGNLGEYELKELLQTMRVGTDRLEHIVQQAVLLTQIEGGVYTVESVAESSVPVYLWHLLPPAIEAARRYAYRNRYNPIQKTEHDPDVALLGDTMLLKHALIEVISNALNFSPPDETVFINQWIADGTYWVSILDQGIGMTESEIERARASFEQIGRESREQQGMGVGLDLAHQLISLHRGTLDLRSVPQKGTQVTIGLPIYAGT